eukprot:jgi/Mesvir1/10727/Mv25433-RA.3
MLQQGAKQPLLKRKQPSPPAIMPWPQGLTPSTPTSSALSAAQEAQIAALYAQIDSIRSGGLASATFGAVSPPPPVPGFEVEPVADKAGSVVLAAVHCAGKRCVGYFCCAYSLILSVCKHSTCKHFSLSEVHSVVFVHVYG